MKKELKIPIPFLVNTEKNRNYVNEVFKYLISFEEIKNRRNYVGSSTNNLGVDNGMHLGYTNDFICDNIVSMEDFRKYVNDESVIKDLTNYPLY